MCVDVRGQDDRAGEKGEGSFSFCKNEIVIISCRWYYFSACRQNIIAAPPFIQQRISELY